MARTLQEAIEYKCTRVIVKNSSTVIIPANGKRRYLLVQNLSDEVVYIHPEGSTAVAGECIGIPAVDASSNPQGAMEFSHGRENMTRQAITAICASGGKAMVVVEGAATGEFADEGEGGISSSSSSST